MEYVTDEGSKSRYWNIPIANTTSLLLGTGTSITQAAMRELAKAGVLVGFCGGGGTPLFAANEVDVDVAWLTPQSEYRPTEYLQYWVRFWFDDAKCLDAARAFQQARLARGLSQTALADQLGLSQRSVSEIESGKPTIYMRKVFDLLRATGVELSAELPPEDE